MGDLETGIVLMLKASGRYVAGEELSAQLGASDEDVRAALEELRSRGYRIDQVPGEGYRLLYVPAVMDGCELRTVLETEIIGREIFPFGQVTSTNDIAISLARSGSPEGTLVIAEEQTRGKGRIGRGWHSPWGLGLWFSVITRPAFSAPQSYAVSLAVALAVAGVLRDAYGIDARIKWPNDVLAGRKKICGILTEAEFSDGDVDFIVVGVGVNVLHGERDFPEELRSIATSIALESAADVNRVDVASRVLGAVDARYRQLSKEGFVGIRSEILTLSSLMGNLTRVKTGDEVVEGVAVDIDETGALILRKENGINQRVLAGDATLI